MVDVLCKRNGGKEVAVEVKWGDLVFFNGVLEHHGGAILEHRFFPHVSTYHSIARSLPDWLDVHGLQMSFDDSEQYYCLPESA